jgi:hypothetical protein
MRELAKRVIDEDLTDEEIQESNKKNTKPRRAGNAIR